jgi:hypothetical protein
VVTSGLRGQNSILTELYYIQGISNTLVQTLTSNHFGNYTIKGKIIKNQGTHAFLSIHLLLRTNASGTVKHRVSCRPTTNLVAGKLEIFLNLLFSPLHDATAPSGPRPPHCRRFTITLKHATFGRTPMAEGFAYRRDLDLTTITTNDHASGGIRTCKTQQPTGRRPTP